MYIFTLTSSALPEITSINQGGCEQPSLVIVDSDKDTPLTCEVFGIPIPSVQWFFTPLDGGSSTQPNTQQLPGSEDGSVIGVIVLMLPDDILNEGSYTCVATNPIGMVSQTIDVVFRSKSPLSCPVWWLSIVCC